MVFDVVSLYIVLQTMPLFCNQLLNKIGWSLFVSFF